MKRRLPGKLNHTEDQEAKQTAGGVSSKSPEIADGVYLIPDLISGFESVPTPAQEFVVVGFYVADVGDHG